MQKSGGLVTLAASCQHVSAEIQKRIQATTRLTGPFCSQSKKRAFAGGMAGAVGRREHGGVTGPCRCRWEGGVQVSVDPDISPSLSRADMLQRAFELVTREVLSDGQLWSCCITQFSPHHLRTEEERRGAERGRGTARERRADTEAGKKRLSSSRGKTSNAHSLALSWEDYTHSHYSRASVQCRSLELLYILLSRSQIFS